MKNAAPKELQEKPASSLKIPTSFHAPKKTVILNFLMAAAVLLLAGLYFGSPYLSPFFKRSLHTGISQNTNIDKDLDKANTNKLPNSNEKETYEKIEKNKQKNQESTSDNGSVAGATSDGGYPKVILPCTRNGNDLLVLVNKQYKLPSNYAPNNLVPVSNSGLRANVSGLYVRDTIINDLRALSNAAKAAGVDLSALSAYRSYSKQVSTYNYWVATLGKTQADRVSARPGHSQHQLGTTIDFSGKEVNNKLTTAFANTKAGKWLAKNAWKYGFAMSYPSGYENITGYSYEPWHFRYIGKANATNLHNSGKILENFLRGYN